MMVAVEIKLGRAEDQKASTKKNNIASDQVMPSPLIHVSCIIMESRYFLIPLVARPTLRLEGSSLATLRIYVDNNYNHKL